APRRSASRLTVLRRTSSLRTGPSGLSQVCRSAPIRLSVDLRPPSTSSTAFGCVSRCGQPRRHRLPTTPFIRFNTTKFWRTIMRFKFFASSALGAVLTVAAVALAAGFMKAPATIRAEPDQPVASADQPCCTEGDCCPECLACCDEDGCCWECIQCCIEMGCDPSCCFPALASTRAKAPAKAAASCAQPSKTGQACCAEGCCK